MRSREGAQSLPSARLLHQPERRGDRSRRLRSTLRHGWGCASDGHRHRRRHDRRFARERHRRGLAYGGAPPRRFGDRMLRIPLPAANGRCKSSGGAEAVSDAGDSADVGDRWPGVEIGHGAHKLGLDLCIILGRSAIFLVCSAILGRGSYVTVLAATAVAPPAAPATPPPATFALATRLARAPRRRQLRRTLRPPRPRRYPLRGLSVRKSAIG